MRPALRNLGLRFRPCRRLRDIAALCDEPSHRDCETQIPDVPELGSLLSGRICPASGTSRSPTQAPEPGVAPAGATNQTIPGAASGGVPADGWRLSRRAALALARGRSLTPLGIR